MTDREWIEEAARLFCEQQLTDYRAAKRRAGERLGRPPDRPPPESTAVEAAVIDYQRLFGGPTYRRQLRRLRETALEAMRAFAEFEPRLVGAAVSGAVHAGHRLQLHLFCDSAEEVDYRLLDRGIAFEQGERVYRYGNGREARVPLVHFEAGEVGVDLALFDRDGLRQAPLSPVTGRPAKRLNRAQVEALLAADGEAA